MGTMTFRLPPGMPPAAQEELERASVGGGQESMPYPTQAAVANGQLILSRQVDESGFLLVPWEVNGAGRLMTASATLMERPTAYELALELARGKVNQLRGQSFDWLHGGLLMSDELSEQIRRTTRLFSQAVTHSPDPQSHDEAIQTLAMSFKASDALVHAYLNQVFQVRHIRQPRLDTTLACRLGPCELTPELESALMSTFNAVCVPFSWADIEPEEERYDWAAWDKLVQWAAAKNFPVVGGPLIDFSGRNLPHWLWEKDPDPVTRLSLLVDFVERVVERYPGIRTWQITAASNWAGVLASADEELLWLTVRLTDAVRKMNSSLELIVGIAQPWGDYLAQRESQSPFSFADNLVRTGLRISALDLELLMGVAPRGSYCRDLLEVSRLIDLYTALGVSLQTTLAYPSAQGQDDLADLDLKVGAGYFRRGFTPETQAQWAGEFGGLCVCKPIVKSVHWTHFADCLPHSLPHCGVIDAQGQPKPSLEAIASLRAQHLR